MDLFSHTQVHYLDMPSAEVSYHPNFINTAKANQYFKTFLKKTPWQEDDITIFGKTYKQPRLTALYGNNSKPYSYSNVTMHPYPFTPELLKIKSKIKRVINKEFTTCLLNLYRDGNDSNGWHADNEKELGINPIIASVSFGADRVFHFKHKSNKNLKQKLILQHGSLLIMKGETQHYWLHQVPKTKKKIGQRINLTFRIIV